MTMKCANNQEPGITFRKPLTGSTNEKNGHAETNYLLHSENNRLHLERSIAQYREYSMLIEHNLE